MVRCCICGVEIAGPCHGGRCAHCLQKEVDITEGVSRRVHIQKCGTCDRYLRPPNQWVFCEVESRELLALCLKAIKGIGREHRLVDASFIWTEPHSKELKVKLALQKEAFKDVVIQQNMIAEIRVDGRQCPDCQKSFTNHTWESSVQVRQRADHRRTILNLEQHILAHGAHNNMLGIEQAREGMDFFFKTEHDAQTFVKFVKTWTVARNQDSKHLVSHDPKGNSARFKRTTCIEVCPICRDDLVYLPPKTAQALGGLPPLMICTKITSTISLLDPASMRTVELTSAEFWKRPMSVACTQSRLTDFLVLDIVLGNQNLCRGKEKSRDCEVEIARLADLGQNDDMLTVRSHLGSVLHVDEVAQGYDLRTLNLTAGDDDLCPPLDVYLVRRRRAARVGYCKHASSKHSGGYTADDTPENEGPTAECKEDDDDYQDHDMKEAAAQLLGNLGHTPDAVPPAVPEAATDPAVEEGDETSAAIAGGPNQGGDPVDRSEDANASGTAELKNSDQGSAKKGSRKAKAKGRRKRSKGNDDSDFSD